MDKKDIQLVKIFDKSGEFSGYKPREEINKTEDIVSTIHIFVLESEPLVSAGSSFNIELVCFRTDEIEEKIKSSPELFAPSLLSVWDKMNTSFIH